MSTHVLRAMSWDFVIQTLVVMHQIRVLQVDRIKLASKTRYCQRPNFQDPIKLISKAKKQTQPMRIKDWFNVYAQKTLQLNCNSKLAHL
jgi:hypothetical protein